MEKPELLDQLVLVYDPEKCTGCRFCEISCVYSHRKTLDLLKSHVHVFFDLETQEFESVQCRHCVEPICVSACPQEAITKDDETGFVTINQMKCIGCQTCVTVCPLSAPWHDEKHKVALKCDFCEGDPLCARFCSAGATKVVTRREALETLGKIYGGGV